MGRSGVVFVLLALLAGAAIGYVIGSAGDTGPVGEAAAEGPAHAEPGAQPVDRARIPAAPGPVGADFLSTVQVPEPRTGDAEISGRVRTEDGRPLPGVEIRVTPHAPRSSEAPPRWLHEPETEEEVLRGLRLIARGKLRQQAERRVVHTDADGAFRLTGLPDWPHIVEPSLEGYRIGTRSAVLYKTPPGSVLELVATPWLTVPVVVLLPDGSRAETASIELDGGEHRKTGASWRSDEPVITVAPGLWTFTATAGEHREFRSARVEVEIVEGQSAPTVELACRALPGIRGRISYPDRGKNTPVKVAAVRLAPGSAADPARLERPERSETLWREEDTFQFLDLAAGRWLVGVLLDHRRVAVHETVEVSDGLVVLELAVPPPAPAEYVEVTVLDPDGDPLEKVYFSTLYVREGGRSRGNSRTRLLGPGTWHVWHHAKPEDWEEGGLYGIRARAKAFGTKTTLYDKATTRRLTIRFDEPATLLVNVTGYAGSGLEGRLGFELGSREKGANPAREGPALSAEGVQRFGPLAPGPYELTALLRRGSSRFSRKLWKTPLDLKSGANRHTLLVPKLHTLTVTTEGLSEGTRLHLVPQGELSVWSGTASLPPKNGRIVFEDLLAGEYVIGTSGGRRMTVRVPGPPRVRFEGTRPR